MSNAPAFQLFAKDFFMDTVSWSIEEIGIYTRLLLAEWDNGPLENDPVRLMRIAGCSPKKFVKWFPKVSLKFEVHHTNKIFNLRLEETRAKQQSFIESQQLKGKLSAEKRLAMVSAVVEPGLQPKVNPAFSYLHSSKRKEYSPTSKEVRLSNLLFEKIKSRNNGNKEPNIQTWAVNIDRMIRLDKREPQNIEDVIIWCQEDDFWKNNILSTEKLRKQFDQLILKMPKPEKW